MTPMRPLVSIITPTFEREQFLPQSLRLVRQQTYPNIEWLILDDSPHPSKMLNNCSDPRVSYEHISQRLTIGEKRNRLIEKARGAIIAHFDDDDYYAPRFIDVMVSALENESADFANLCSWYMYDFRHGLFGFWDLKTIVGIHYLCYRDQMRVVNITNENNANLRENYQSYGFTYVYRRQVWEANPFPARNWGEDSDFVKAARTKFRLTHIPDSTGLVLHTLHVNSSSSCFPQYRLPNFLLPELFPEYRAFFEQLTKEGAPISR